MSAGSTLLVAGERGPRAVRFARRFHGVVDIGLGTLRHAGENSLPIYLGFFLPMTALLALQVRFGPPLDRGLLALLLAAASILVALAAFRLARSTRARLLYERPRWARLGAS